MSNESKNKNQEEVASKQAHGSLQSSRSAKKQESDSVKEMAVSAKSEELIDGCDPQRQKKIAKMKAQYLRGELKAQESAEIAKKLIKKFNL